MCESNEYLRLRPPAFAPLALFFHISFLSWISPITSIFSTTLFFGLVISNLGKIQPNGSANRHNEVIEYKVPFFQIKKKYSVRLNFLVSDVLAVLKIFQTNSFN